MKGLFYGSLQTAKLRGTNLEFSPSLILLSIGTVDPSVPLGGSGPPRPIRLEMLIMMSGGLAPGLIHASC